MTHKLKLNIGAGPSPFPGWVNYDHEDFSGHLNSLLSMPLDVLTAHDRRLAASLQRGETLDYRFHDISDRGQFPHTDGSVDAIYLGQVIEHLNPVYEVPWLLNECRRMLRLGGVLRITTPNLDLLIDAYKRGEMDKFIPDQPAFYVGAHPALQLAYLMYGASGPQCSWRKYEGHMCLYTPDSMMTVLRAVGFTDVVEVGAHVSRDPHMCEEVFDAGMSHSFIVEAVR